MTAFNSDILPPSLKSAMVYQDLAAGEILFHQNDPAAAIFAVESGRVSFNYKSKVKIDNSEFDATKGFFLSIAIM